MVNQTSHQSSLEFWKYQGKGERRQIHVEETVLRGHSSSLDVENEGEDEVGNKSVCHGLGVADGNAIS